MTAQSLSVHRVLGLRRLSAATFVLRLERGSLSFEPGQYVYLGLKGSPHRREYTVYSGAQEEFLEVLIREVEGGLVSRQLRRLESGDEVEVQGPFGGFLLAHSRIRGQKLLFVASGTGISPFHCFVKSYEALSYSLLHGVSTSTEFYEHQAYDPTRLVRCVSRGESGYFRGRVTDYLRAHPATQDTLCYLCGNCDMIYEVFAILRGQGLAREQVFTEVYF